MKHLLKTAFISVFGIGVALAPASAAEDMLKVKVAYDGFSMTTAPMQYAMALGLFEKHGLDVDLTYVAGGSVLTQAVVGGSVDIAQNGYTPAIAAAVAGADLSIIAGIANKLPFQLVVDGSIKSADDLRGKSIAISRLGSSTDTGARFAVESLGLSASDVNILQLGGEGSRAAAFLSNQVNGLMSQYPRTQEMVLGKEANVLVDLTDIVDDYPNTAYVTSDKYLAEHPEVVRRFLMAMAEGLHEFRADPDAARKVTAGFLKMEDGPAVEKAFHYYSDNVYAKRLEVSRTGVAAVLAQLAKTIPAAASVSPESIIDTSVLDALVAEGFFETLK